MLKDNNDNAKIAAVTGGTGLLGSRLIFDLLSKNYKVKALKRKNSSLKNLQNLFEIWGDKSAKEQIQWIEGDVLSQSSLEKLAENADFFFHAAAIVSFEEKDKDKMMEINIYGTKNAIFAALSSSVKKFCHVSSIAALGRPENPSPETLIDENCSFQETQQNSNYAISKYLSEKEVWKAREQGLKFTIVNPSVILGATADERSTSLIFTAADKGNIFYTDGVTGFVDLRDVSSAIIALTQSNIEGERFIINEGNHSYKYIFSLLAEQFAKRKPFIQLNSTALNILASVEKIRAKIFNSKPFITKETAKIASSKHFYSNQKIKNYLNFQFTPIEESIKYNCFVFNELKNFPHKIKRSKNVSELKNKF